MDKPLKWGWLYRCSKCGQAWYLDGKERMMRLINEKELSLIEEWTTKKLILPDNLFKKLKDIQAVSLSSPGNEVCHARIPCKVITNREEIDFADIYLENGPPSTLLTDNVRLIDEIKDIKYSVYALPSIIRYETHHAPEIAMGYSPTEIIAPDGRKFVIDGYTEFFDCDGYKGNNMKLVERGQKLTGQPACFDSKRSTLFYGDWDDKYKSLFMKKPY